MKLALVVLSALPCFGQVVLTMQAPYAPVLVIDNPAASGPTQQSMIGFSNFDGTSDNVHGWVGQTSHSFTFAPFADMTYIENQSRGGLGLLSDDPVYGKTCFFNGGYTDKTFLSMCISANRNVGIGMQDSPAQFRLDVHDDTNQIHAQTPIATGQGAVYVENERGAFASYGGVLYGGSAELLPLFGVPRADRMFVFADGASNLGLIVGTLHPEPVCIGTNNLSRLCIDGSQGIPVYPNNAAAIAGGLAIGSLYRTGTDPDPICIVH